MPMKANPEHLKTGKSLPRVPRKVFSGMAICGKVIGAKKGYMYLRGEYQFLLPDLLKELEIYHEHAKELGIDFTIEIRLGSGAYICGEESALFESMEGNAVNPATSPPTLPLPDFMNKPTVINNVETFVNVLMIMRSGRSNTRNWAPPTHADQKYSPFQAIPQSRESMNWNWECPSTGSLMNLAMAIQKPSRLEALPDSAFRGKNSRIPLSVSKAFPQEVP